MPKLLIIGHARHGKDTAGDMLEARFGLSPMSSSVFAGRRAVWPFWGKHHYPSFDAMFDDRVNHRETWSELIWEYNQNDPARLAREMIVNEGYDVYIGMRNADEFAAARPLFDAVLWIDASRRLPKEDNRHMTMTPSMADHIIDNNGPLEVMEHNLTTLVQPMIDAEDN